MAFQDFMNRIRQWDNRSAQWIMRHFYILFFEIILVVIFVFAFANSLKIIDAIFETSHDSALVERLLLSQSINTLLIVILLLFNSFWMLFMLNSIIRLRSILRNIDYNIAKQRYNRR